MGIKENFNISLFDDISNKKSGAKNVSNIYTLKMQKSQKKSFP